MSQKKETSDREQGLDIPYLNTNLSTQIRNLDFRSPSIIISGTANIRSFFLAHTKLKCSYRLHISVPL
jgi:hypothetical protein